jgi:hypothetical protein
VSLSVSNNYLYDEGIGKLVKVLQKTTAPLELLDLSKTNMTSVGAKLVAQLLEVRFPSHGGWGPTEGVGPWRVGSHRGVVPR